MKAHARKFVALSMTAACAAAVAGTPINETRDVDARARVDVSNVRGSVTVSAWDRPQVSISGTLGDGSKGLEIDGGGSRLSIRVKGPENSGWFNWGSSSRMEDSILVINVPREAELEIEVVSAEVVVSGVAGRLLDVDSVSGKIRVDSNAGEIEVGSVSGRVELNGRNERVQVETVSGEINVASAASRLKFETVSGDIHAETGEYRELNASSVSGDIILRGNPAADARLDSETMSGDVRVRMPKAASARIEAETFSGRIRSDFGTVKEPEHGSGRSLDATVGGGSARINIETFSGDIEIRGD